MKLYDIIGKQPPLTNDPVWDLERVERIIITELGDLKSEWEDLGEHAEPDDDELWTARDACDTKITFLEGELDRVKCEIHVIEDKYILRNERELEDRHRI